MARIEIGGNEPTMYTYELPHLDRPIDLAAFGFEPYSYERRFHGAGPGDWTYGGKPISGDQVRPLTMYPKGVRWPWYPALHTTVVIEDETIEGFKMRTVGDTAAGRVGLREWWRQLFNQR